MEKQLIHKVGALTTAVITESMASGLSWDEAVAALGVAARAMAAKAAREGIGTEEECILYAQKRFQQGVDESADVLRAWLT